MTITNDVVIIGSGPAGLTASIYLSRAMIQPIVFMGHNPGGQLITSPLVENYPGAKSISGCDLMFNMDYYDLLTVLLKLESLIY